MAFEGFITSILKWVDFPVLISTILGGIIVWRLAESSKKGKLKIFIIENQSSGVYPSETGGFMETTNLEDDRIAHFHIRLILQVYNSADYVKIARRINFQLTYTDKRKEVLPAYQGTDKLISLNFEPKKLEEMVFDTSISKESYLQMRQLSIIYINESGRTKKVRVDY
jgi:hypothetical protein